MMARIKIDEYGCSNFFRNINNVISGELTNGITSFNNQLDILNDGVTWRGSDAIKNVGDLINCYNEFLNAYNNLIEYFVNDVPQIFTHYNQIISANGGQSLTIAGVSSTQFQTKTLNDLSFSGEDGDPDKLLEIKPLLESAKTDIQTAFNNIKTSMDQIGDGSEMFDTSAANINYAENFKTEVKTYISNLDSKYEGTLNICISNIQRAAENLKA